ncbi:MAG: alpha/beta hydrolase [Alkalilacustris sp.]
MEDYVLSVRNISRGAFGTRVGATSFLAVPQTDTRGHPITMADPERHRITKRDWFARVQAASVWAHAGGEPVGDVVVYIHGYNTSQATMLERQRKLRDGLAAQGFRGVVIGFDWPSADRTLSYLPDRKDAKASAQRLVDEGISAYAARQRAGCRVNVHLLAHSMGCYVVREAFDDADDRPAVAAHSWTVSQVMLVGADVSAASLGLGNPKSSSLYRRCVRLTNYFNPHDGVLSLSNVKRVGVSPRAGRVGLPIDTPNQAANVYCGTRYLAHQDSFTGGRSAPHNWYFDDAGFMRDVTLTVQGELDRNALPTRAPTDQGNLALLP